MDEQISRNIIVGRIRIQIRSRSVPRVGSGACPKQNGSTSLFGSVRPYIFWSLTWGTVFIHRAQSHSFKEEINVLKHIFYLLRTYLGTSYKFASFSDLNLGQFTPDPDSKKIQNPFLFIYLSFLNWKHFFKLLINIIYFINLYYSHCIYKKEISRISKPGSGFVSGEQLSSAIVCCP